MGRTWRSVVDKTLLTATVNGIPRPKGSLVAKRSGGFTQSKVTMRWCTCVADQLKDAWGEKPPHVGPVLVVLNFYLPGDIDGPPDLDKLARAALDSINATVVWAAPIIADDGQVTELLATKRRCPPATFPCMWIRIAEAE